MSPPSLLLIHPPGWDACVSGPYAAGPYLQGFVRRAGFGCRWVDLNLALANRFTQPISASEARLADQQGLAGRNRLYFGRQAKLEQAAARHSGHWTLKEAYQPDALDQACSASVRAHLDEASPYDEWLAQILAGLLTDERPNFLGISVTIPQQLFAAFQVAKLAKRLAPDVPIVLAGNVPTRLAEEMTAAWVFDRIDILASHQGEETCVALLKCGTDRTAWASVPNIRYHDSGGIRKTGKRLLDQRLFAPPDFGDVRFDDYWGYPYATLMGSRGCYYGKCPFCAIPFIWGETGFRGHDDPLNVFETMRTCVDTFDVSRFKFVEESMYAPSVDRLATRILEEGLNVTWEGYVRMDKPWFDPAFLQRASRAGLRKVYVGIEVLEGESRALLGKKDRPAAEKFLSALHDAGILAHVFVLVGHPGTGLAEAIGTIEFALKHRNFIDTLEVSGFRYEKHTTINGLRRLPDPGRDWALDDPYASSLSPTLPPATVDLLERELFEGVSMAVPAWTHPIHHMASPWAAAETAWSEAAPAL